MTQQLNFVLSYWIDYINYQNTKSASAAYVMKFADQDERYTGHRFCQENLSEPAYEDHRIWFFHPGDRDEPQASVLPELLPASTLPQWVPASAYAGIDAATCSTSTENDTDADLGSNINCAIAKDIANGTASPFPQGQWPQISDGNGGNSTSKTFHPTTLGGSATSAELNQRLQYLLPTQGGKPHRQNLTIVAVGDSITWGYTSSEGSGYRKFLYDILAASPSNRVEFVGSQLSGTAGSPWERSEGYPGLTAGEILETLNETEVKQANVMLLMAGTNDVNLATSNNLSASYSNLTDLTTTLLTLNPTAPLIIAHITPIGLVDYTWPPSTPQQRVINWNTQTNLMVNRLRLLGARILKVHTTVTVYDHVDTVHPTDTGYEIPAYDFAERMSDAQDLRWLVPGDTESALAVARVGSERVYGLSDVLV